MGSSSGTCSCTQSGFCTHPSSNQPLGILGASATCTMCTYIAFSKQCAQQPTSSLGPPPALCCLYVCSKQWKQFFSLATPWPCPVSVQTHTVTRPVYKGQRLLWPDSVLAACAMKQCSPNELLGEHPVYHLRFCIIGSAFCLPIKMKKLHQTTSLRNKAPPLMNPIKGNLRHSSRAFNALLMWLAVTLDSIFLSSCIILLL